MKEVTIRIIIIMITGNKDSRNHAIVFSLFAVPIPRTTPDNIAYNDNDTALSAPTFPVLLYYILPKLRFFLLSEDTLIRVRVLKSKLYSRGWLAHHPQNRTQQGLITVQDTMIIIIWIILYGLVIFPLERQRWW